MSSMILPAKPFASVLPTWYRKHKVIVVISDRVTLSNLNWDGGSRRSYTAMTIDGGRVTGNTGKYAMMAPWNNPAEGKTLPLPPGYIVISTGTFCGKPAAATIYINPADTGHAKFASAGLPAPVLASEVLPPPRGWDMVEGGVTL